MSDFNKISYKHAAGVALILLLLLFLADLPYESSAPPVIADIQHIKTRGKLIATTQNNSTDYFIYKGHPLGFQLEMLQWFADYIGVKLELVVSNDNTHALSKLSAGKCDIVAMDVSGNKNFKGFVSLTNPYAYTGLVLVQRKPTAWEKMSKDSLEGYMLRNYYQLKNKTIFIPSESFPQNYLYDIAFFRNLDIHFSEISGMGANALIALVESGEIDYTICYEQSALLKTSYFNNLDFATVLGAKHPLTWAVRSEASSLLDTLNAWFANISETKEFNNLYAKYFKNPGYKKMVQDQYFPLKGGRISPYDEDMKILSKDLGWDWRLLASLVFQESKFDTGLTGIGGSMGIMQLMPATAERYGASAESGPVENLKAGVRYLKWLDKHYSDGIHDVNERIFFVLAAYNIGHGHVDDARRLTVKYNYNPNLWYGNVEDFLILKSNPVYYRDPVVKSGYCRCNYVKSYVANVFQRYRHYLNATE